MVQVEQILADGVVFPPGGGSDVGPTYQEKLRVPHPPHTPPHTHKHMPLSIFLVIGSIAYGRA